MAKGKQDGERRRVFVAPPTNIKDMSDEELEQWAEEAILTPLLGPPEAEPEELE